eukprot:7382539-Prymnesium_polylepis.1
MTAGQSYLMGECLSRLADERQLIEVQEHCAKRKKAGQAHNSSHACVVVAVGSASREEKQTLRTLWLMLCRLAMAEAPPNGDNVENRRSPWPTKAELTNADSVETRLPPVSASPLSEIEGRRLTSLNRVAAAAKACESLEFFLKLALRKDPVIAVSKACASLEPLRKLGLRAHVWGGLYTHVRCLSLKLLAHRTAQLKCVSRELVWEVELGALSAVKWCTREHLLGNQLQAELLKLVNSVPSDDVAPLKNLSDLTPFGLAVLSQSFQGNATPVLVLLVYENERFALFDGAIDLSQAIGAEKITSRKKNENALGHAHLQTQRRGVSRLHGTDC